MIQLSKLGSAQADQNVDVEQSPEMAGTGLVCEDVRALEKQRNSAAIAAADNGCAEVVRGFDFVCDSRYAAVSQGGWCCV